MNNIKPVVIGFLNPWESIYKDGPTYRLVRLWTGPVSADGICCDDKRWKFVVEYKKNDAMGDACWCLADDSVIPWIMGAILNKVARLD